VLSYISLSEGLKFAVRDTGNWLTRTIDDNPLTSEFASSMAIDPDTGYPAIAYTSSSLGIASLKYAQWDGNDWGLTTIDDVGDTGHEPSLAFDPTDGNPAIAYYRDDTTNLKFAWHDGANWQDQVVDAHDDTGRNPSIAFREYGEGLKVAAITYFDEDGKLWYIEDPPPSSVPEPTTASLMLLTGIALTRRNTRAHTEGYRE